MAISIFLDWQLLNESQDVFLFCLFKVAIFLFGRPNFITFFLKEMRVQRISLYNINPFWRFHCIMENIVMWTLIRYFLFIYLFFKVVPSPQTLKSSLYTRPRCNKCCYWLRCYLKLLSFAWLIGSTMWSCWWQSKPTVKCITDQTVNLIIVMGSPS